MNDDLCVAIDPTLTLSFHPSNSEPVATFKVVDGVLCFEGNMDAAAQMFFEHYLKPMCDNYLASQSLTYGVTAEGQRVANQLARKDLE